MGLFENATETTAAATTGEDTRLNNAASEDARLPSSTPEPFLPPGSEDMAAATAAVLRACLEFRFSTSFVLGLVLTLGGTVGNVLTTITFWPHRNNNSTNLLLITLAFFDTMLLFCWFVFLNISPLCDLFQVCKHYDAWVKAYVSDVLLPLGSIAHMAGTWNVVVIAYFRYVAACRPHRSKVLTSVRRARVLVALITVASFVYYIPWFSEMWVAPRADGSGVTLARSWWLNTDFYRVWYSAIFYYVLIYVLPFAALIFCSARVLRALRRARARKSEMTRSARAENDVTWTLMVVVITFMFLQLLNPIRRLLAAVLDRPQTRCPAFYYYYWSVSTLAVMLNCSINFLLYCVVGKRFRHQVRARVLQAFCCRRGGPGVAPYTDHTTGTGTDSGEGGSGGSAAPGGRAHGTRGTGGTGGDSVFVVTRQSRV